MSDTPRMKAAQMAAIEHGTGDVYRVGCDIERELNAASKERDDALMMLGMYRMKSDEQKQRIKRLEEAGDAMEQWTSEYGPIYRWRKAKEAKP